MNSALVVIVDVVLEIILATLTVQLEKLALRLLCWVNKLAFLEPDGFSEGWLDMYQVQIVPFIANAFSIFLFYQYFDSIPKEFDEAAKVDGPGWFRIYRSIVMPLSGPAVATVAILTLLPTWDQYLWELLGPSTTASRTTCSSSTRRGRCATRTPGTMPSRR